jgi:hypothetical protein
MTKDPNEMTPEQIQKRIIRLAFDGDQLRFREFVAKLKAGLPAGTGIVMRGSVITNKRFENGGPFDEKGRGTSDLDVTLVGNEVMKFWDSDGYYIPALHTKPLCDEDRQVAAKLNPLREELQRLAGRPVNFQATANLILFARDVLFDEPYLTLVEAAEKG